MKIIDGPHHVFSTDNIHFRVMYQGESVLCAITSIALEDDYQANGEYIECFEQYTAEILVRVEAALPSAPEVPDGTPRIVIKAGR